MILTVLEVDRIGFQHHWEERFHVVTRGKTVETETRMTESIKNMQLVILWFPLSSRTTEPPGSGHCLNHT